MFSYIFLPSRHGFLLVLERATYFEVVQEKDQESYFYRSELQDLVMGEHCESSVASSLPNRPNGTNKHLVLRFIKSILDYIINQSVLFTAFFPMISRKRNLLLT